MLSRLLSNLKDEKKRSSKPKNQLQAELLEDRAVPAANVVLSAGVLTITGDSGGDRVQVSTINNGAAVQVQYNTATNPAAMATFRAGDVQSIVINGNGGDDYLANLSLETTTINGGTGNDYLQGGLGNDNLNGQGGDDIAIDNTGGSNNFTGGTGNDVLSSTVAGANMNGGDGNDILYDIIGGSNFNGGNGTDIVIATAADPVLGGEQNVRFGTTTAAVARIGDVLYINGGAADDSIDINNGPNNTVRVVMNGVTTSVSSVGLRSIAVLGGAGNDRIDNNTALFMVAYGGDGNDDLRGGDAFDFLKGGGGNDLVSARSSGNDFISGDAGADTLVSDNSFQLSGKDIVAADPTDTVMTDGNDIVVGTLLFNFRNA
jgi:Ca2+-binding RTX toxin-like protein